MESTTMHKQLPRCLIATSIGIGATVSLCAAAAAAGAIEMASGDACKLLTAAQVSTVLGVQADEGTYSIPGNTQFCTWREHGKPQITAQNVQVHLLTAHQYEAPKATPFAKGSESGLGDEAYWSNTPGFGFALSVKKGGKYFRVQSRPIPEGVTRKSDSAADKAKWEEKEKAVEKAIAPQVLKNL